MEGKGINCSAGALGVANSTPWKAGEHSPSQPSSDEGVVQGGELGQMD